MSDTVASLGFEVESKPLDDAKGKLTEVKLRQRWRLHGADRCVPAIMRKDRVNRSSKG
jgi:hypothetical protein